MENIKRCAYCGKGARFRLKNEKYCCEESFNKCPEVRRKNSSGLKKAYKEGRKKKHPKGYPNWGIAWNKGESIFTDDRIYSRIDKDKIFIEDSKVNSFYLRKYAKSAKIFEYKCKECGLKEWKGKELTLELDHINGHRFDHRIENLRWLCPNCHSQTDTFRGKNIKADEKKDEEIIEAIESSENIRQTLLNLNMAPKGGNYNRVKKLINKYGLKFKKKTK